MAIDLLETQENSHGKGWGGDEWSTEDPMHNQFHK